MRSLLTLLLFSLAAVAGASIASAGDMVMLQPLRCFPGGSCDRCLDPPWHESVRAGSCGTCEQGQCCPPVCEPCAPSCDPCGDCYRRPPLFPRLHAWCCNGALLCPTPPRRPQCRHCGAPIEGGL
jgi:hypothetical protein